MYQNLDSELSTQIQKTILKKFFKASEVKIETKDSITYITLKSNLSEAHGSEVHLEVASDQLNTFLCDCVLKDPNGLVFYTNMLKYLASQKEA